jgi:predicted amidophosphoribosyltransferase
MSTLKDITTGEARKIHICYECDPDTYPTGKPIDPSDTLAEPNEKGEWVCGKCQIEEFNKRKLRVLGLQHPEVQRIIQQEHKKVKAWNSYAKKVNRSMNASLKYRKNRYAGKTPFCLP